MSAGSRGTLVTNLRPHREADIRIHWGAIHCPGFFAVWTLVWTLCTLNGEELSTNLLDLTEELRCSFPKRLAITLTQIRKAKVKQSEATFADLILKLAAHSGAVNINRDVDIGNIEKNNVERPRTVKRSRRVRPEHKRGVASQRDAPSPPRRACEAGGAAAARHADPSLSEAAISAQQASAQGASSKDAAGVGHRDQVSGTAIKRRASRSKVGIGGLREKNIEQPEENHNPPDSHSQHYPHTTHQHRAHRRQHRAHHRAPPPYSTLSGPITGDPSLEYRAVAPLSPTPLVAAAASSRHRLPPPRSASSGFGNSASNHHVSLLLPRRASLSTPLRLRPSGWRSLHGISMRARYAKRPRRCRPRCPVDDCVRNYQHTRIHERALKVIRWDYCAAPYMKRIARSTAAGAYHRSGRRAHTRADAPMSAPSTSDTAFARCAHSAQRRARQVNARDHERKHRTDNASDKRARHRHDPSCAARALTGVSASPSLIPAQWRDAYAGDHGPDADKISAKNPRRR
ncbi:hypothetical protein C8R47DRAFT_1070360 [Mycena vitilis]|nr:hypothetical protein C8R47DRAFT_1070360 [Mycena vitilis]